MKVNGKQKRPIWLDENPKVVKIIDQRRLPHEYVVERHKGTGNIAVGFVKGFGFKKGAIASSVAHDSHNIIFVTTNDEDMKAALNAVVIMSGGLAAASDREILADLPLPIAGLMSMESVKTIQEKLDKLTIVARALGTSLSDPFVSGASSHSEVENH